MENLYGIYLITCLSNGKILVGEGKVKDRLSQHKSYLKNNRHPNKHLQSAYNLYGKDNFTFELLFYCDSILTKFYEDYLCRMLDTHNPEKGFNKMRTDPNKSVFKHTPATVEHLREVGRNRKHTAEAKEKCRISSTGRYYSQETRKKLSNLQKGRIHSDIHRDNLSKALINNKKLSKPVVQMTLAGEFVAEFPSVIECHRQLGYSTGQLCDVLNGKKKTAKGFKWKYKNNDNEL